MKMSRGGKRPGAGRPAGRRFSKALYVGMEPELLDRCHEMAAELKESTSALVRSWITEKLDALEAERDAS